MLKRQGSVLFERIRKTGHRAGNADGKMGELGALADGVAMLVQMHILCCQGRSHFPVINGDRFPCFGNMGDHEPPATKISRLRQGDGQREPDGDGGVHSVSPLLEDLDSDFGGDGLLSCHHSIFRKSRAGRWL